MELASLAPGTVVVLKDLANLSPQHTLLVPK